MRTTLVVAMLLGGCDFEVPSGTARCGELGQCPSGQRCFELCWICFNEEDSPSEADVDVERCENRLGRESEAESESEGEPAIREDTAERCQNSIDDDGDGRIDCEERACKNFCNGS